MKQSANVENIGVAFVSFKEKDCVNDTLEEMDLVKAKLVDKDHYDSLDIKNWEVEPAYPYNDIIWSEINKSRGRILPVKILLTLLPFLASAVFSICVVYLD